MTLATATKATPATWKPQDRSKETCVITLNGPSTWPQ